MNRLISSLLFAALLAGCSDAVETATAPSVVEPAPVQSSGQPEVDTYPQEMLDKCMESLMESNDHGQRLGLSAAQFNVLWLDEIAHHKAQYIQKMEAKGYDAELIESFACQIE